MTYKNEKQLKEEVFLLANLFLVIKGGLVAGDDGQEKFVNLANNTESHIKSLIAHFSQKSYEKWQRMIAKINQECGTLELLQPEQSSHRFVLVMHAIMLQLKLDGYKIAEETEALAEMLLEFESLQPMPDEEWLALKNSATKRGIKILAKLQELGLFNQTKVK